MRCGQWLTPSSVVLEVSGGSHPEEPSKQGKTTDRNKSEIYAKPATLNGAEK